MKTLQKTLLVVTALTAATAGLSLPALANAQPTAVVRVDFDHRGNWDNDRWDRRDGWDRGGRWDDRSDFQLDARIDRLQDRIDMGARSRQLSRSEAARLNDRLGRIIATKRAYERSGRGLDGREVAALNDSLDRLSDQVRFQGRDGNRW